jgi:hypothetical protein
MNVTAESQRKISWCFLKAVHSIDESTAYFAMAISYARKMFIKSTTGLQHHPQPEQD